MNSLQSCAARAALILALVVVSGVAAVADDIPADLVNLVPAEPMGVLVISSIDAVNEDIRNVGEVFGDEDMGEFDVLGMMGGLLGGLGPAIDRSGPVLAALRVPAGGFQPMFSILLPLQDPGMTAEDIAPLLGAEPIAVRDGYVVLGNDTGYVPGEARPDLLSQPLDLEVSARIDVSMVFDRFGPMIEPMIQGMMAQAAAADSTGEADGSPQGMKPGGETVDSILQLVALLRDGVQSIELGVGAEGSGVLLAGGMEFTAGGPLELGPQVSLDEAWARAGLLDPDAMLLGVSALDLTNLAPLLEAATGIFNSMEGGPSEEMANFPWGEYGPLFPDLMQLYSAPMAFDATLDSDGMDASLFLRTDDPVASQETLLRMLDVLDTKSIEVGDLSTWQVGDFEIVRTSVDVSGAMPAVAVDDSMARAFKQATELVSTLGGELQIAAGPADLVVTMGAGDEAVAALLGRLGETGEAPARLKEARDWAGPGANYVFTFDLRPILGLIVESFEGGEGDRPDAATMPAVVLESMMQVEDGWLRGRSRFDLASVAELFRALSTD